MEKIILTVKEVSELLNVSLTTVYSLVRSGDIPSSRIKGKIVFHQPTIEIWITNGGTSANKKIAEK